jgi:hypothetical protein
MVLVLAILMQLAFRLFVTMLLFVPAALVCKHNGLTPRRAYIAISATIGYTVFAISEIVGLGGNKMLAIGSTVYVENGRITVAAVIESLRDATIGGVAGAVLSWLFLKVMPKS